LIVKRAILVTCAISALVVATGVFVLALAFALFSALTPSVGPALAAVGVAGATLIVILILAVAALLSAQPAPRRQAAPEADILTTLFEQARSRPLLTAAALVGIGLVALRNPKMTASLVSAFMTARAPDAGRPRGGA